MTAKYTPGPWLVAGRTVYSLQQDGWRKGEPIMVNRFWTNVSAGYANNEAAPEAEMEANARLMPASLDLAEVLQRYVAAYPAFRMKPVGAEGSPARIEQENLMALEELARAALKKAGLE